MIGLGPGPAVAVVDVGGTDTKSAVVDATGAVVDLVHTTTPRGPDVVDRVVDALAAHVARARADRPGLAGVGLVVPGIVDAARGSAVFSENLDWHDVPFRDLAVARTGLPVGFGHDVASAGRAEHLLGAARGARDAAALVIGTGIAVAVISDGRPVLGGGWAGELGHSVVDPHGPICVCGTRGCLEAIASTASIARRYGERTGTPVPGSREVLEAARRGDPDAEVVWEEALDALAVGLRQLAAVVAPEVVVVGGGLAAAGPLLLDPLAQRLAQVLPPHRVPALRPASIGVHAGLVGAALLAREAVT